MARSGTTRYVQSRYMLDGWSGQGRQQPCKTRCSFSCRGRETSFRVDVTASALRLTTRSIAAVILERSLLRMTHDLLVAFLDVWKIRPTLCLPRFARVARRASASCLAARNLVCLFIASALAHRLWPAGAVSGVGLVRARTRVVARRGLTGTKSAGSWRTALGKARMEKWGQTKTGRLRRASLAAGWVGSTRRARSRKWGLAWPGAVCRTWGG